MRRFENTGLNEETLKEVTEKEIERLTEKVDPKAKREFDQISALAKKILFNRGSQLIQKYQPTLHERMQHQKINATISELR